MQAAAAPVVQTAAAQATSSQICTPAADSNDQRIKELLQLQEGASDSVIRLDDTSLREFASQPEGRPYTLVVLLDAVPPGGDANKVEEFRKEFGLAASAFVRRNKGTGSEVFFVEPESSETFLRFGVNVFSDLPTIRFVPPDNSGLEESFPLVDGGIVIDASHVAACVEKLTGHKVGDIQRPPLVTKQQKEEVVARGAGQETEQQEEVGQQQQQVAEEGVAEQEEAEQRKRKRKPSL